MKYYEMRGVYEFVRDDLQPKNSPEWEKYKQDMDKLFEELEPYFTPDQNKNYKAIYRDDYDRINDLFDKAAKSSQEFLNKFKGGQTKTQDGFGHPYPGVHETMKNLNDEFFSKAYVEFKNIKPDPHFALKDQMENFRYTSVQINNNEIKKLGGNQSTRLQMTVNLDGKDVKGVFTDMTHFEGKKDVSEIFTKMSEKYPKYKDFFASVNVDEYYNKATFAKLGIDKLMTPRGAFILSPEGQTRACNNFINLMELDPATAAKGVNLAKEPGFYEALIDFAGQMDDIATPTAINKAGLSMKEGDRIDVRNSAMSGVASLLGCSDLIAKSRPLAIYDENGKKFKEGTFMEFAKGKDINNLAPVDELRLVPEEGFDTPEVRKQIADLQVLDYICGNIDRHGGNILYDVDPVTNKVKGIVGIDNDSAFGKKIPNANQNFNRLPGVNNLRVITDDMAKTVAGLTEGQLKNTLHGYGLDEAAINAAWKRTQNLQEAIKNGKTFHELGNKLPEHDPNNLTPTITIMGTNDAWNHVDLEELNAETKNCFGVVQSISTYPSMVQRVDPFTLRRRQVGMVGLNNAMNKIQTGYLYDKAKAASPWFFTSTRYKNILSTMKEYHEANFENENPIKEDNHVKFEKFDAFKAAIETYKSEKIRDGFIDDKWNLKKGATGKDLDRILLVKEMETYVKRVEKEKKAFEEINKTYKEKKKNAEKANEFLGESEARQKKLVNDKLKKQGIDVEAEQAKLKQEQVPEVVVSNEISSNVSASLPLESSSKSFLSKSEVEESKLEVSEELSESKQELSKDIEEPKL